MNPNYLRDQVPEDTNVVWSPLEGAQADFISCPADVVLFEGSRGPGKTDAQVMDFRKNVGRGYGQHWRGVLFDRAYKNLDDVINKSLRWFPKFNDGARFLRSKSDYKWIWPTGEELLFRQFQKDEDYWNYHGQEFAWIGWNELCKFPTPKPFDMMMSCNRTSFIPELHTPKLEDGSWDTPDGRPLPEIPLRTTATANPLGPGHNWVKIRFIDPAPPGVPVAVETEIYNPRTGQDEVVTQTQVRLFGSYKENIFLPPKYIADLVNIKEPNRRKAWLEGDWNIVAGGAIDDLWNENVHMVPRFRVPDNWPVDRSFDWGSSHPFAYVTWAVANGEAVRLPNGKLFTPAPGSLVACAEWYGVKEPGTNEGMMLSARKVARGILELEQDLLDDGWIDVEVMPGPADNQIYDVTDTDETVESIAKRMEDEGLTFTRSDKSKGSRKNGLELLRVRLEASVTGEGPGIYFMSNCVGIKSTLPTLPRNPKDMEDVDTTAEDHLYDAVRYRCLSARSRIAKAIETHTAH